MLLNQAFSLREAPRALFWIGVFLISFFGMFYLGLNPELIEKWYLVLVLFNVIMSGVAIFYITLSMKKLKTKHPRWRNWIKVYVVIYKDCSGFSIASVVIFLHFFFWINQRQSSNCRKSI